MARLRIGTRGSPLALWQAGFVRERLEASSPGLEVELVTIHSAAERFPEKDLAAIGVGVFTREIDAAVGDGRVDAAVHSLKDLPTELLPGLVLAAVPERGSPLDAWVAVDGTALAALPRGARIGSSSPRRRAQLLHRRPDLDVLPLRGNVETRLRKLRETGLAGAVLAAAGLMRLGLERRITELIPSDWVLPAVGQGAIAVVCRAERREVIEMLAALEHAPTRAAVDAERAFLKTLRGGCQVPAGALARHDDAGAGAVVLEGVLCSPGGDTLLRGERRGEPGGAEALGRSLAGELLGRGGEALLRLARGEERAP
jgi:hydroxymethylbilane synthase